VCGESDEGLGGCSGQVTWDDATSFCGAVGARLCTAAELSAKETSSTGCKYDKQLLWSSTECDGGYSLVSGKGEFTDCASETAVERTRCCADASGGPVVPPVPAPTPMPIVASASSCEDLGWTNLAKGSSSVCGESDDGLGGCSGELTWTEATSFCGAVGARLCTAAELSAKETKATGCGYDSQLLWSSTECDGGFSIVSGTGDASGCAAGVAVEKVRCCADTSV